METITFTEFKRLAFCNKKGKIRSKRIDKVVDLYFGDKRIDSFYKRLISYVHKEAHGLKLPYITVVGTLMAVVRTLLQDTMEEKE